MDDAVARLRTKRSEPSVVSGHRENAALARAMLQCGADVAARYKGRTALHWALALKAFDLARALLRGPCATTADCAPEFACDPASQRCAPG